MAKCSIINLEISKKGGIMKIFNKSILLKSLKIAAACTASVFTAYAAGLDYYLTAGIITILSIQNTKRETLKTAVNRGLAFVCAIIIAAVCFNLIGYNIPAFCVYIFIFVTVCLLSGWPEAMAMDSVLISHFIGSEMAAGTIINEALLFIIGTCYGIIINMSLRSRSDRFNVLSDEVDIEIKGILERMAERLVSGDKSGYDGKCFNVLSEKLDAARNCALRNWNNSLIGSSTYEMDYIEMRQKQGMVLMEIYKSIIMIEALPGQRIMVAEFMKEIVADYHRDNAASVLLEELSEVFEDMKSERMPESREEFEARAVLFYILKQLEEFLLLKNRFASNN